MGPTQYEHRWDAYGLMPCDSLSAIVVRCQLLYEVIANVWISFTMTDKVMQPHWQKPWTRVATSQEEATYGGIFNLAISISLQARQNGV